MIVPVEDRAGGGSGRGRWRAVVAGGLAGTLLAVLAAVGALFALHPIMGAKPIYDWGNGLWVLSAALVGAGIAAPPGPARRLRTLGGVLVAVVWFLVGRFAFGP